MDAVKTILPHFAIQGEAAPRMSPQGAADGGWNGTGGEDGVQGAKTSSPSEGKRFWGGGGFDMLEKRKRVLL